jgi:hypothetical protein
VKTVGEDRDRAGKVAERYLGDRNKQIEDEDAAENADDGAVAIGRQFKVQNSKCKHHVVRSNGVDVAAIFTALRRPTLCLNFAL